MLSKTLTVAIAFFACAGFLMDDGLTRERNGSENDAAKDSLEGKAPPALDMELWMNAPVAKRRSRMSWSINGFSRTTEPATSAVPTWDSLKGKVVILDFWAYW